MRWLWGGNVRQRVINIRFQLKWSRRRKRLNWTWRHGAQICLTDDQRLGFWLDYLRRGRSFFVFAFLADICALGLQPTSGEDARPVVASRGAWVEQLAALSLYLG